MLTRGHLISIKRDGRDGSVYPVTTSACSVGRGVENDIRILLESTSQEHCVIYTSDFQPAVLKNLSSTNPTKVNNVPICENEHRLEHGDVITTGERSFRWEYLPQSRYYISTKAMNARPLSTSPLRGSTGMVGMPISVLQSTLGSQSFNTRSGIVTESKIKSSPPLMASNEPTISKCDTAFRPSKRLVAVVNPQRRPQSEKKVSGASAGGSRAPSQEDEGSGTVPASGSSSTPQSRKQKGAVAAGAVTVASSSVEKSVAELRNQSSAKRTDFTPSNRKSNRLYSKSARQATEPDKSVKVFQNKRSWQALVTTRKTPLVSSRARKSVGGSSVPSVSRIPTRVKSASKLSGAKTPQSSKKSRKSGGNLKEKTPVSAMKKKKSEQKRPVAISVQERKRKLESGLRSAERAAKRLKLESPKTPDKKKMAALLVCHGKVSRPKTPQFVVSSSPQQVAEASKVKRKSRAPTSVPKSRGSSVRKTTRKKSENLRTSSGEITSVKDAFSLEIPKHFNFDSDAKHLNVSSGQRAEDKGRPLGSFQKSRRSHVLKSEQTVSPELGNTADLSGVAELLNSPVKAISTRKTASLVSGDTVCTPTAVLSAGRHSRGNSGDLHTRNVFELQTGVSSGKKTPKHDARQSLFERLMKSMQSNSALNDESVGNAETPEALPNKPHVGRKSRSVSVGSHVTSDEAIQTSSRKSRNLSAKRSLNSQSHSPTMKKFSSSPELEQKARSVTVLSTPVSKQTASRRSSGIVVHSPKSVESTSRSVSKSGDKGTSVSSSTPGSKLSGSVRRSRSSVVTRSPKSDESDSRSPPSTGEKGKSVSPSMSAYKKAASAMKSKDTVVSSSPESIVQTSTATCLRASSGSPAGRGRRTVSISGSSVSPKKSKSVKNLSPHLDEEGPSSSGPRFKKSSERHVRISSRSESSLESVPSQKSMLLRESGILYECNTRSSQKRASRSSANQTQSPPPSFQNTTFDFDAVGTPHIPLEEFVSPLSSSRKQKSLRWQDVSTSIQKRNSEPAIKRRHISAKNDGNVTSPSDSPVHVLSPQQLFSSSLIDEPVHTFCAEGRGWKSRENSFSDGVKTRASPKNASPNGHAIQKMKKISPTFNFSGFSRIDRLSASSRISKSFENDLRNISGVQELMKARSTPKSSVNDLSGVCGGRKRMTVPRTPKSPKDFLTDVHVMEQPTKERRSPKSPKNDLGDVRGVRNLMKTPRSPTKSPKNDLRDVHGVRNLMKTPRSPKSPKNDLTDVRGVKRLMTSPKTVKSPLNDLSDVRGVKRLMTTYQVTKSPKNDISDVDGVKELLETPSPRSVRNNWTVTDDAHHLEKTPSTSPSPRSGSRAAWTHSKPKSPDGPSVSGKVPSIATRTHHRQTSGKTTPVKWSPKYIKTEVPVTDKSDAEGSVDQMNVPMPEEVKTNARSRRNRKVLDLGIVKADTADGSPTPWSKKTRQKENKVQNSEDLLPEMDVEISVGSTGTSISPARPRNRVHFDIPNSPAKPVARVTRGKRGVVDAEVELQSSPPETRKTVRSKRNVKTESVAKEDINDPPTLSPSVRKTRGTKSTSVVEVAASPARRKRGTEVAAAAELSSPVPSKRQRGVTAKNNIVESSPPRTRRGGIVTTSSELSSPPRTRRAVTVTVDATPSPSRRRRGAIVTTETAISESPVTKKTRGKSTLRTAVTSPPIATAVPLEGPSSSTNKQSTTEASPSPAGKRQKRGTRAVEQPAPKPARKLRGMKLSDVSEDETGSSSIKTRSRKTRVISSPVSKAKSPPVVSRRGGKRSTKKEVSPQAATERRTRASQRRK